MDEFSCEAMLTTRDVPVAWGCTLLITVSGKRAYPFPLPSKVEGPRLKITRSMWIIQARSAVGLYLSGVGAGFNPFLLFSTHFSHDDENPATHTQLASPLPTDKLYWLGECASKWQWADHKGTMRFVGARLSFGKSCTKTLAANFGSLDSEGPGNWIAQRLLPRRRRAVLRLSENGRHSSTWIALFDQ